VKEQTEKSTILNYIYENISKDDPSRPLSPLSRFYKRLYGIVSSASQPLLEALNLQCKPTYVNLPKEYNIKAFEIRERLVEQYRQLSETVKHANLALPQEIVEEILVDAIMSVGEEKA
jgi:actin-like ATPase involved in cell morphogenesis